MVSVAAMAKPALRTLRSVTQSDGTTLTIYLTGDELFHYYCTADGKPLIREANGDFSYAVLDSDGRLASSSVLAHDKGKRTMKELQVLATNMYSNMDVSLRRKALSRREMTTKGASSQPLDGDIFQDVKPVGTINVPLLLVQYKDVKFTFGKDLFEQNYNGSNFVGLCGKGIGSARDYFIAQSDSLFQPNFVVMGIVTLENDIAYYGANDKNGEDVRAEDMIIEGCLALDDAVDFSIFDNNGDGTVEFIYCVYAGYSESSGASDNTIWPHKWELSSAGKSLTVDGVKIDVYATSSELAFNEATQGEAGPQPDGIGTLCHEFSHCIGLPDLYDTSGRNYPLFGMDYWDIMDYGCYNADGYVPIGYSAYERDFMGWRKLQVLTDRGDYSMKPITDGGVGYKIVNGVNSDEYYILENRQQQGYDAYIPNGGMLVHHVDYDKDLWRVNEVNYNMAHPRYTIIPADNKLLPIYRANSIEEYHANLRGDVWPGTSRNNELTDNSEPAAKVYTGGYMGKSIRNIEEHDGVITFSFMKDKLATPVLLPASAVSATGFTANWSAVQYASAYEVELKRVEKVAMGQGVIYTLLQEDFLGCTLANSDVTDHIDDYTIDKGWVGMNLWSETGVLRIGSAAEYGEIESPTLKCVADGDITLTFMAKKYRASDGVVELTVQAGSPDGEAVDYDVFTIGNDWQEYSFTFTNEGDEFVLLFTTEESPASFRVCIDDIVVTQESTEKECLLGSYTTSTTGYTFDALTTGRYRYRVRAIEKGIDSDYSLVGEVELGDDTSIESPVADDEYVEVYSLSGVSVYKGAMGCMPELTKGVYVLRSKNVTEKIYCR